MVLPVTMRNVGDLIWKFEERMPLVSENHLRARAATEQAWRRARGSGGKAYVAVEQALRRERERAEEWVRRGK